MADPNGYFRTPTAAGGAGPQAVVVKIQQVAARPELNGRFGIAGAYQADRGRYLIHLVPNANAPASNATATLSLKPENVVLASWTERMQAQYQLLRYDPRVHQEVQNVYQQCARQVAPLPLPAVAGIVALLWLASCYFLGFTLTLFWSSLVGLVMAYVAPFLIQNRQSLGSLLQNLPSLVQRQLEQRVPAVRGHLDRTKTIGIMVTVVVVLVLGLGYGVRSTLSKAKPSLPWETGSTPTRLATATSGSAAKSILSAEEYYALGFEDATGVKAFGTSLPAGSSTTTTTESRRLDGFESLEDLPPMPPPKPPRSSGSTSNMMSTVLSAFFVGKTVWELGRDPTGPPMSLQGWNLARAQQGVTTLPTWQKAILGISVYRLFSALMGM